MADNDPVALAKEWRCFQCDELFTDKEAAADHFGWSGYSEAACRVDGGLAHAYRVLENELRRHREEDTDLHRALFSLGSEAETKRHEWGDKEYAKGLADGRAESLSAPGEDEEKVCREILARKMRRDPCGDLANFPQCALDAMRAYARCLRPTQQEVK